MNDEGLADAAAANPFRLPRLHPGIGSPAGRRGGRLSYYVGLSSSSPTRPPPYTIRDWRLSFGRTSRSPGTAPAPCATRRFSCVKVGMLERHQTSKSSNTSWASTNENGARDDECSGGRATARKRSRLVDELVDLREQRRRDRQPQRVRGFQIDHRLERGWLLDGQIRGLGPLDDLVDVVRRPLVQERIVGGQRHEGACDNGLAITRHVRESALRGEVDEHLPVRIEVSHDDYRPRALFRHGRERALEVVDAADDGRDESNAGPRCRRLQILHERTAERIGRRGRRENGHAVEARDQLLEELEALAADLRIDAR